MQQAQVLHRGSLTPSTTHSLPSSIRPTPLSPLNPYLLSPLRPPHTRHPSLAAFAEGPPRPGQQSIEKNGGLIGEYGERVVVAGLEESEDIKLECDESGCVLVVSKGAQSLEEQADQGHLCCNLTGCYYSAEAPTGEFKVLEGTGWRLGYETAPASEDAFAAMVGAGGWSIALTASEFHDWCKLIQMLRKGILTMDQDGVLGREEDIVIQVEKGTMWMECVVPKKVLPTLQKFLKFGGRAASSAFEIRFILTGKADKRQAEGYWPAEAVMDMLKKMDELTRGGVLAENGGVAVTA